MKSGIWEWLCGMLLVEVRGSTTFFVNKALRMRVELREMSYPDENCVRFYLSMTDFLRLPHPFPNCDITVLQRYGLPVVIRKLQQRRFFVTGAMLFLLVLNILALFVWKIEVRGAERIHYGQVTRVLAEASIYIGTPIWNIDREEIKEHLQQSLSAEVSWVNLTVKGSKITIELVERPEPFENRTGDIFALESGVITQINVQQGEALYQVGALVRQGDPVILGFSRDRLGRYQPLRAEAQIQARVWRQAEVTVPYRRIWHEETGNSMRLSWLRLGESSWPIGSATIPYSLYQTKREKGFGFFDFRWLNAEIFDIIYVELREEEELLSPEEAEAHAESMALAQIAAKMPATARLQNEQRETRHEEEGCTVRLVWESLEEIGLLVPHR